MAIFMLFALVGMAFASQKVPSYDGFSKQLYNGMYPGNCVKDGFYYQDEYSFMMCSNGNSYTQKCAPGTKNSGYAGYAEGTDYYLHDFCDVNLVDTGYNGYAPGFDNKAGYAPAPAKGYAPAPAKGYAPVPAHPAPKPAGYHVNTVVEKVQVTKYAPQLPKANFQGKYGGACSNDGFYYNNEDSFVMCSNGNAYIQRCAPGSKNGAYDRYQNGNAYYYNDFCGINLVDYGYGAHHGGYQGYPSYHAPAYHYQPNPRFFYWW